MNNIIASMTPYAAAFSSLLSIAVLGLIMRLSFHLRNVYKDRIDASQERNTVLEERLRLAEDKFNQIDSVNRKVTEVGAALGIAGFKEELARGVSIRDIGDNFSGNIAGGDIIDTINKLGDEVSKFSEVSNNYKQEVGELVTGTASITNEMAELIKKVINMVQVESGFFQYRVQMIFDRSPDSISQSLNNLAREHHESGWRLVTIVPAYQSLDGCAVILRKLAD